MRFKGGLPFVASTLRTSSRTTVASVTTGSGALSMHGTEKPGWGVLLGHTSEAFTKKEKSLPAEEKQIVRCALLGNSFCSPIRGWLVGQALVKAGILATLPSILEAWGPAPAALPQPRSLWSPSATPADASVFPKEQQQVAHLIHHSVFSGIRRQTRHMHHEAS